MKEKDLIEFNLNSKMATDLINFNSFKKELIQLKNKKILNINDKNKIVELENKLECIKQNFIKEFRKNNKKEIEEYLKLKEKI